MAHTTPSIQDGILTWTEGDQEKHITVESAPWWRWLAENCNTTFRLESAQGQFTARHEWKKSGWYWYAYRKHQKKLHKAYLGKATELTLAHLHHVAQHLTEQIATDETPIQKISVPAGAERSVPPHDAERASTYPLLATKLFPPPSRSNTVSRPRLLTQLNTGLQRKMTLLSAPAGFGKSTLLSAWCHTNAKSFASAWLSLEGSDNNPTRFWRYIIAALQTINETVSKQMESLVQTHPLSPSEEFLTLFINALTPLPGPIVVVLDDYHLITNPVLHEALAFFLEHLPPQVHLIIASRSDPPLPLARLRARGELHELHASDLRFSSDEVNTFLCQAMGLQLSSQEVMALNAHTEGWVAGLQLAALSMQGQQDTTHFIRTFTGNHRYILEYLTGEVLQRQPEAIQSFLLHTSILERLSVPLCNAITEREDSAAVLKQLEEANLFLIPLDEPRQWYRYHHLFAEFLQERLRQEQPALVPVLHQRACRWYEQYGVLSAAVKHAMATGDRELVAQLVERFAQTMLMRGEVTTFLHWLNAIPAEITFKHFQLLLYKAGALITIGQLNEAEACLHVAEGVLKEMQQAHPHAHDLREREAEFVGSQSILAAFRGDVVGTLAYADRALHLLSPENSFIRSVILAGMGTAYLFSGDIRRAHEAYNQAIILGEASHNQHAVLAAMACQGYLEATQGHLHQAATIYQHAIQQGTRQGGQMFSVVSMVYVLYGCLHYEWNDLDTAERYAHDGIELGSRWGYVGMLALGYSLMALVHCARGQTEEALAWMQQAERLVLAYSQPYVSMLVAAYQARIHLLTGNTSAAAHWITTFMQREQESTSTYLEEEQLIAAEIHLAMGQFTPAQTSLEHVYAAARTEGHHATAMTCQLLQAILSQQQGDHEQALLFLEHALKQGEAEGYRRTFIDRGQPVVALLRSLLTHKDNTINPRYIRTLLDGLSETIEGDSGVHHLLSEREIAVLQHIAAGQSNQQIAQEFIIAISTVKTHINNIYTKIGVRSRTQAVARAKELGLVT